MSGMLSERDFVILWLLNLLVAVIYLLVGALVISPVRTRKERKAKVEVCHDNRRTYLLRFLVMVLCPVVAPLFFLFSYILFRMPLWMQPSLSDVVFSKERVKIRLKADEERERDMIPLEEALAAPVEEGQEIGRMTVTAGGQTLKVIPLVADRGVARLTYWQIFQRCLKMAFMGG